MLVRMDSGLVPVGAVVKRTEAWHHRKREQRGGGWSDRQREDFKRWEADERAERWTVAEHLAPHSEHNASSLHGYKLAQGARIMWSTPSNWEAA